MKHVLLLSLVLLATFVAPAKANFIAPTTSTTGTYTIDWTFTGQSACNSGSYTYPYKIQETNSSGTVLFDGGLQGRPYSVTSRPVGTYTYKLWTYLCSTSGDGYVYRGSTTVQVTANPAPSAPVSFTVAVESSSSLNLNWVPASEFVSNYEVQKNNVPYQNFGASINSYVDSSVSPVTNYTYRIRACLNGNCSGWKVSNTVTTPPAPPVDDSVDPIDDAKTGDLYTGFIWGEHAVNNNGTFTYSIPVDVPDGVNGLQPDIGIGYNSSNSKNGLLGWGWGLKAGSGIGRCPADVARDGYRSGINSGDKYKFCLDGTRLVEVADREYRTELESFSRIKSYGGTPTAPDSWVVEFKNGRKATYGSTNAVTDGQGNERFWYISQLEDTFGNKIKYAYVSGTTLSGAVNAIWTRLESVSYDYSDSGLANKIISFGYEARPDVRFEYVAGSLVAMPVRLTSININVSGSMVKSYALKYQPDVSSYISRLAEVQKCARFDGANWQCTPTKAIGWNQTEGAPAIAGKTSKSYYGSADFNGDGKLDTLTVVKSGATYTIRVKPYGSSDVGDVWLTTTSDKLGSRPAFYDFDGDGLDDVVFEGVGSKDMRYCYRMLKSTGVSFQDVRVLSCPFEELSSFDEDYHLQHLMDVNGDGLKDVVTNNGGDGLYIKLNNRSGGFGNWSKWIEKGAITYWHYHLLLYGDFNGDGMVDVFNPGVGTSPYNSQYKVFINKGDRFELQDWGWESSMDVFETSIMVDLVGPDPLITEQLSYWTADVNGDGLTDILSHNEDEGSIRVKLSTGIGFSPSSVWMSNIDSVSAGQLRFSYKTTEQGAFTSLDVLVKSLSFVDINKDGCSDILAISTEKDTPGIKVAALSTCDVNKGFNPFILLSQDADARYADASFGDDSILNFWGGYSASYQMQVGDTNRDGILELSDEKYAHTLNQKLRLVTEIKDFEYSTAKTAIGGQTRELVVQYDTVTSSIVESYKRSTNQLDSYLQTRNGLVYETENTTVSRAPIVSSITEKIFSGQASGTLPSSLVNELKKEYKYKGYLANTQGWGSMGFAEVSEKTTFGSANPEYLRTETKYYQLLSDDSRLVGVPSLQTLYASANGTMESKISETQNRWKIRVYSDDVDNSTQSYLSPHYFPYKLESTTKKYDLRWGTLYSTTINSMFARGTDPWACGSCLPIEKITADAEYTANGALKVSQTVITDQDGTGWIYDSRINKKEKSDFKDIITSSKWVLDLPGTLTETAVNVRNNNESATREMAYTYTAAGQVYTETIEPNKPALYVKTTYGYNTRGTRNSQVSTWNASTNDGLGYGNSRQTSLVETRNGNPIFTTKDFSGYTNVTEFSAITGKQVRSTDANGRSVYNTYDILGRAISETSPGNVSTKKDYRRCDNCFPYSVQAEWYSAEKTTGASAVHTYYDAQDREVGTRTKGLNGQFIYTYKTYNHRGQVETIAAPFYAGETQKIVSYEYDVLGRKTKITYPDLTTDTYTYIGIEERFTNRENQENTRLVNSLGWTLVKYANDHGDIDFTYWPFGELKSTTGSISKTQIFYDDLGRKTRLVDPSSGTTNYTYNSLGLLSSETDANGIVTRYGYDQLNRQVSRTDNALGAARQHTWIFDSKVNGKGALGSVIGVDTDGVIYKEDFEYNSAGLVRAQTKQIKGNTYTTTPHYDRYSRSLGLTYPSGFKIKHSRNAYGHLDRIINNSSGQVLWKATDANAQGNLKQFEYGNGVITNKTYDDNYGRVKTIQAQKNGFYIQNQEFEFSSLGNFKTRVDKRTNVTESFCYDLMNRLEECNDFTRNEYSSAGNITKKGGNTYTYESVRPYAVKTALGNTYAYDAAGQMLSGAGRSIQYSTFGTPTFISRNGAQVNLAYGSNKDRIYRYDSSTATTVTYVNLGQYEISTTNNVTTRVHYLGDFAQYKSKIDATTGTLISDEIVYVHRDHLGSIVAESDATASAATNINWRGFDPWGKTNSVLGVTSRGYTDHEHLMSVGLIHMNGRVFDPELGRFLSPDPLIQAPENTQSYNRYSYVFNNPMSLTDPTGYETGEVEEIHITGYPILLPPITIDSLDGLVVQPIQYADLPNAILSNLSGVTGTISPIEGNAFLGAMAITVEELSWGIIWGETGSILMLKSNPQIEANKEAARNGMGGPLLKVLPFMGMVRAGGLKEIGQLKSLLASNKGQVHHICTNKNCVSAISGGPWTPRFQAIFEKAGLNLNDPLNKVLVLGHKGPHPELYHQTVFDRLTSATNGLDGAAYKSALQNELRVIGAELQTPGSLLNNLVTN